jgi:hypothetical protein
VIDPNSKKLQPCFAPIKIKTKTKKGQENCASYFLTRSPLHPHLHSLFFLLTQRRDHLAVNGDGHLTKEKNKTTFKMRERERGRREGGLTRKGSRWRGMRETS